MIYFSFFSAENAVGEPVPLVKHCNYFYKTRVEYLIIKTEHIRKNNIRG